MFFSKPQKQKFFRNIRTTKMYSTPQRPRKTQNTEINIDTKKIILACFMETNTSMKKKRTIDCLNTESCDLLVRGYTIKNFFFSVKIT